MEEAGIVIESQAKLGKWVVDFLLVGTPIVVEADGSYWHSKEKVRERDARKDAELRLIGIDVHRVDELDFYKRGAAALEPIIRCWRECIGRIHFPS